MPGALALPLPPLHSGREGTDGEWSDDVLAVRIRAVGRGKFPLALEPVSVLWMGFTVRTR